MSQESYLNIYMITLFHSQWIKVTGCNTYLTHLPETFCELTGGKSSSRLNLIGVEVTWSILLLSFPSDEFSEFVTVTGYLLLFGDFFTFFADTLSIGLVVTLPPLPDGGVEKRLPLALLLAESLLVSDAGVRCLGSHLFFVIFFGDMTGKSDVK